MFSRLIILISLRSIMPHKVHLYKLKIVKSADKDSFSPEPTWEFASADAEERIPDSMGQSNCSGRISRWGSRSQQHKIRALLHATGFGGAICADDILGYLLGGKSASLANTSCELTILTNG